MAWQRVELLFVLTGTLLLVSVRGWVRINESDLLRFYETGQWNGPDSFTEDDVDYDDYEEYPNGGAGGVSETSSEDGLRKIKDEDIDDYDYGDDVPAGVAVVSVSETSPEDVLLEVEGVSTGPKATRRKKLHQFLGDDDYKDENPDTKGLGTTEMTDQVGEVDSGAKHRPGAPESGFHVLFVDAPPRSWITCTSPANEGLNVVCSEDGFQITLPPGLLTEVQVVGLKNISVMDAHKYCGYHVNHVNNTLTIPFTGCNVREDMEDIYSLQLLVNIFGHSQEFTAFCVESMAFDSGLFPRAFSTDTNCNRLPVTQTVTTPKPIRCVHKTTAPPMTKDLRVDALPKSSKSLYSTSPPPNQHTCAVHARERLPCGHLGISVSDCKKRGCCAGLPKPACYYPLDQCTVDQHFIFAIRHDSAPMPVDPKKLVIPGRPLCKPAIVNDKVAIFKIKFTDCGARSYDVGEVKVRLIEVHTAVHVLNLKYGLITRSDPVRFLIECRYHKRGVTQQSMASVGYMVKTAASIYKTSITKMPSSIISNSSYAVELRIAKDHTYSSYFPTHHQPLRVLLGHPVYLELILKSPAPDAVILVNYCLAYPDSATNALVLVYEGCANPNDPSVAVLQVNGTPNNHQRRFVVNAFHFMDQKTNLYLNEEINFMCSVEVCRPSEKVCEERCFDGKVPEVAVKHPLDKNGLEKIN